MNEIQYMDYVMNAIVDNIRPLLPKTTQQETLLTAHPDRRAYYNEQIALSRHAFGVRSAVDLGYTDLGLTDIIWGVERIVSLPAPHQIAKKLNAHGGIPKETAKTRGYLILEEYKDSGDYVIETDLVKVTKIKTAGDQGVQIPVQKGQNIEDAVGILMEYIVKHHNAERKQERHP